MQTRNGTAVGAPVLQAMVQVQRLTGCRPGEIFNMRVGEIDRYADPDLWLYWKRTKIVLQIGSCGCAQKAFLVAYGLPYRA
jgi:hypothetical protein